MTWRKQNGIVVLMYHELELRGRSLCQSEPGYLRYIVSESSFRKHIAVLRDGGWHGLSVSTALRSFDSKSVAITFDDGCETDLLVAAPILRDAGFSATSYITAAFVGRPGYLSSAQVRNLAAYGVEVGCHSMSHAYLNDLDEANLHREIVEAKEKLEQISGVRICHFSCPGGRWNQRVADVAREAGYNSVVTSRIA